MAPCASTEALLETPALEHAGLAVERAADSDAAIARVEQGDAPDVVLLAPRLADPVRVAQRLHSLDRKGAVVVLADEDGVPGQDGGGTTTQTVKNALGLSLQTMTPALAQQLGLSAPVSGVVITNVDQSSDAASKGLQPRDIIVAVGQRPVKTVAEAAAAVDAAKKAGYKTVLLLVQRGNRPPTYLGVDLAGK